MTKILITFLLLTTLTSLNAAPSPDNKKSLEIIAVRNAPGSRIINGDKAVAGQFPWQAAIVIDESTFCGGALISDVWILTAAHCVVGYEYRVILGTTDWRGSGGDPVGTKTEFQTNYFIQHEDYNENNLRNDVGLIKLPTSVTFNTFIKPIRLSDAELNSGEIVTSIGWGRTSENGQVSNMLNYVDLISIRNADCNDYYMGQITSAMVCAASNTNKVQGPCNGDSGGGLVLNGSTDPEHVGITSFVSSHGCESGYPAGYTRTYTYRAWINNYVGF